jgi:excisionase family DNA binding protein
VTAVAVLSPEQLEALVRKAVREELEVRREAAPQSDIMTREQVAELLDVTEASVTAYVKKRGLRGAKMAGGEWRFRRADVLAWLDKQGER